jgi:gamma-glutamylcyclotransferase (GGCT)/AIG2-like uncharacterized protein YtfP
MILADFETYYYFAYGMNTDSHNMEYFDNCRPVGTALLKGYHLVFDKYANIELGGKVIGALWEIDAETLDNLDYREGYPGFYQRKIVSVTCNGRQYNAIVYYLADDQTGRQRTMPSEQYINSLLRGYKEFNIPVKQITQGLIDSGLQVERSK